GRSMTWAPASRASDAIPPSSVLTTMRSTSRARRAAPTARTTNGMPPTVRTFLPRTPFEPARAGMTTHTPPVPLASDVTLRRSLHLASPHHACLRGGCADDHGASQGVARMSASVDGPRSGLRRAATWLGGRAPVVVDAYRYTQNPRGERALRADLHAT